MGTQGLPTSIENGHFHFSTEVKQGLQHVLLWCSTKAELSNYVWKTCLNTSVFHNENDFIVTNFYSIIPLRMLGMMLSVVHSCQIQGGSKTYLLHSVL